MSRSTHRNTTSPLQTRFSTVAADTRDPGLTAPVASCLPSPTGSAGTTTPSGRRGRLPRWVVVLVPRRRCDARVQKSSRCGRRTWVRLFVRVRAGRSEGEEAGGEAALRPDLAERAHGKRRETILPLLRGVHRQPGSGFLRTGTETRVGAVARSTAQRRMMESSSGERAQLLRHASLRVARPSIDRLGTRYKGKEHASMARREYSPNSY
jgi:hypothetical protein